MFNVKQAVPFKSWGHALVVVFPIQVRHVIVVPQGVLQSTGITGSFDEECISEAVLLSRAVASAPAGVILELPQACVLPFAVAGSKLSVCLPPWAELVAGAPAPPSSPPALQCALALKLVLNALTTGAHTSKGLVVSNVMANM